MKKTEETDPEILAMGDVTAQIGRPLFAPKATATIGEASRRAAAMVAERAAEASLLDVGYGFADSPFGRLMVAVTERGVVRVEYPDRDLEEALEELADSVSPRVL